MYSYAYIIDTDKYDALCLKLSYLDDLFLIGNMDKTEWLENINDWWDIVYTR